MKQKTKIILAILFIVLVLLVILLVALFNEKKPSSDCNWEPGDCKNICTSENYFFSRLTKNCGKYIELSSNGGCCTIPPFETLEKCQSTCE